MGRFSDDDELLDLEGELDRELEDDESVSSSRMLREHTPRKPSPLRHEVDDKRLRKRKRTEDDFDAEEFDSLLSMINSEFE